MTDTATQPIVNIGAGRTTRQTHAGRFQLAEHVIQGWAVMVEHGTTMEDVLKPEFFAHVSRALRPFAKISVLADDGSFYAELLVKSAGATWANVVALNVVDLTGVAAPQAEPTSGYSVGFGGPHHKWRVLQVGANEPLSKGHESEAAARGWLADHLKVISR